MGGWGGWEQREGERTTERTRETRKRGRRRKGRGQCRRTEPEALKLSDIWIYGVHLPSFNEPSETMDLGSHWGKTRNVPSKWKQTQNGGGGGGASYVLATSGLFLQPLTTLLLVLESWVPIDGTCRLPYMSPAKQLLTYLGKVIWGSLSLHFPKISLHVPVGDSLPLQAFELSSRSNLLSQLIRRLLLLGEKKAGRRQLDVSQ